MDQVHVEAPAISARAASVEREFYSDFPLVLNYVARLMDDIDGAAAVTCAAFRQIADGLRHRPAGEGMRRADVLRIATDLSRESLRSEEHTSELQSHLNLVCRLLLEKKKIHNV